LNLIRTVPKGTLGIIRAVEVKIGMSANGNGGRYHYYACRRKRVASDKRTRGLACPKVKAGWLEELIRQGYTTASLSRRRRSTRSCS
jgi:hypothetical protein